MSQTFARVADGIVVEIVVLPDGENIADCFHESIASSFIACSTAVQQGYLYDGKTFNAPTESPVTSDDLLDYAAAKRYAIETGGIAVDGVKISTDRQSQALITGAYAYVQANPKIAVRFKASGGFVELTAPQMTAIANAVGAHVQAAFAAEGSVEEGILAGSIKSIEEIDAFNWPING